MNRIDESDIMTMFTRLFPSLLIGLMLGAATYYVPAAAASASDTRQSADVTAVEELVRQFAEAQAQHDAAVLRDLTSEQYVEISPLGEVDPREKMLGFYTRGANFTPPTVALDERTVTLFGDTALISAKLQFSIDKGGQSRSFAMRAGYVAHKEGGRWKLVSMQATPIRSKS